MGPAPAGMCWSFRSTNHFDHRRDNLVAVPHGQHVPARSRAKVGEKARQRMLDPNRNPKTRKGRYMMGVSKAGHKFRMRMKGQPSSMHDTEEEAARAYDRARIALSLPPVNYPEVEYQ